VRRLELEMLQGDGIRIGRSHRFGVSHTGARGPGGACPRAPSRSLGEVRRDGVDQRNWGAAAVRSGRDRHRVAHRVRASAPCRVRGDTVANVRGVGNSPGSSNAKLPVSQSRSLPVRVYDAFERLVTVTR
jgi:hypothetical protein